MTSDNFKLIVIKSLLPREFHATLSISFRWELGIFIFRFESRTKSPALSFCAFGLSKTVQVMFAFMIWWRCQCRSVKYIKCHQLKQTIPHYESHCFLRGPRIAERSCCIQSNCSQVMLQYQKVYSPPGHAIGTKNFPKSDKRRSITITSHRQKHHTRNLCVFAFVICLISGTGIQILSCVLF